jgi:hypothetical protein
MLEQILSRLVKKFFKNNIISLVNSNIFEFDFLRKYKKLGKIVKRLEQILSRLVKKYFKNDIVSLVKIQIYSNLIF